MPLKLSYTAVIAAFMATSPPLAAQQTSTSKPALQLRMGATLFSPLAKDELGVSVKQGLAPTFTGAYLTPLRPGMDLEISAAFAPATLHGEDSFQEWDAGSASVGSALIGVGYHYRGAFTLHGGVGVTRFFVKESGVFASGTALHPLLEAGISATLPWSRAVAIDARGQTHTFTPGSWSDQEGSSGTVLRGTVGVSVTLGRSAR